MAAVTERCKHCLGQHEPDRPEAWVNYRGFIFRPPFRCMCCGNETCVRQWAYGRTCGPCDTGSCQNSPIRKATWRHDQPPWRGWEFEDVAKALKATPEGV